MAADSGIDPRYAAQFQRGFDPAQHGEPPRRGPMRIDNGPPPVVQRVAAAPLIVAPPAAAAPAVRPASVDAPTEEVEELPVPRPRSEWAVLGVAVLFLILAAAFFKGAVDVALQYNGMGSVLEDQIYALAVDRLYGPFLIAGVVALCLWIVLRAVRLPQVKE